MSKTYEQIWQLVKDYETRQQNAAWKRGDYEAAEKKLTGVEWWNVFEYLDWKYNNCAFTDLAFSRKLETVWAS